MRIVRMIFAAIAVMMLCQGCAGGTGVAGVSRAAKHLQLPAIVAIEAAAAGEFQRASSALEAMPEISADQALAIARGADAWWTRLAIARLAYDATIGADAPDAVRRGVDAARALTNVAYAQLLERLGDRGVLQPVAALT